MQTLKKIKYVEMENQWYREVFLVNDKKVNNHSIMIDICNAIKISGITYIHLCWSGQRWPLTGENTYTKNIFENLKQIRDHSINPDTQLEMKMIQCDIAINTKWKTYSETIIEHLLMWKNDGRVPATRPLGIGLNRHNYRIWN